jgi:mevalonate kinase
MPAVSASAPGKIILFGEHAVVYGRPALAVPVSGVRARAVVTANPTAPAGQVRIQADDIGLVALLEDLPPGNPLALAVRATAEAAPVDRLPALRLHIRSTIPIASGLGSGAAVSAAIARALSTFLGRPLSDAQVSDIAYQVDQLHHGAPSGIDNTVIAYAQPIYFVRGQPFQPLHPAAPFTIVIGNTGISSPTREAVAAVRTLWEADRARYNTLFDEIAAIVGEARRAIETGSPADLGPLMVRNHAILQALTVSAPSLDRLVEAALAAGAGGAKLCGGGRGGNMIALAAPERVSAVVEALLRAGAVRTIQTTITDQDLNHASGRSDIP